MLSKRKSDEDEEGPYTLASPGEHHDEEHVDNSRTTNIPNTNAVENTSAHPAKPGTIICIF